MAKRNSSAREIDFYANLGPLLNEFELQWDLMTIWSGLGECTLYEVKVPLINLEMEPQ